MSESEAIITDEDDEQTTFVSEIQQDSEVCNNCFRRTHWKYERNFVVRSKRDEVWLEEIDGIPDHSYRINGNTDVIPAEAVTKGTLTVCECGMPRGAKLRPLTKSQANRAGQRIIDRLEELGHEVNEQAFYDELKALKTSPANQFKDDEMLDEAVQEALSA